MTISLAQIYRHPIKAHGLEALSSVDLVAEQTMPWDRVWAVAHSDSDVTGAEWVRCGNFTRGAGHPSLMAMTSSLDETSGKVTLRHPDAGEITVDPDADGAKLIDWLAPLSAAGRAGPSRVIRAQSAKTGQGLTDNPSPYLSLLNMSSLRALGQKAGRELSPLRFRGNLWVDGAAPWEEFDWVGKRLRLGEVELQVEDRIDRCRATEANPTTGKRDTNTLALLEEGWGHRDFGVFARVVVGGKIATGDTLQVIA